MNINDKTLKKIIFTSLGISIASLFLAGYNYFEIEDLASNIQNIQRMNRHSNYGKIKEILNELNQEKQVLTKEINIARENYQVLLQEVNKLERITKKGIQVKRDNIFFSKELERVLKKIMPPQKTKNKQIQPKKYYFAPNMNNSNAGNKKNKKKKKNQKYHISIPSIFIAKKVTLIGGKNYLYLLDGKVLTKGSYYNNKFKVLDIDTINNYVKIQVIDPHAYEYKRIYNIPFQFEVKTVEPKQNSFMPQNNPNSSMFFSSPGQNQ